MPTPPPIVPLEDLDPITLARFLSGESDSAESNQVRRWIASDAGNAALMGQLQAAWDPANALPDTGASWNVEQALAQVRGDQVTKRQPSRGLGRSVDRSSYRSPSRVWMAAAAVCVLSIATLATLMGHRHPLGDFEAGRSYATAAGERANVTLPDGSTLTLAPQSRLTLAASYGRKERLVMLEGEAYFAVKHDAAHPFSVQAQTARITDVGTQFDVRHYPTDGDVRIVVTQGEVSVGAGLRPVRLPHTAMLYAGDMATMADTAIAVTHAVDAAVLTAWMQGALVFNATPLSDAIRDLARNYDLRITVADSGLATQRITGTFGAQSADEILDLVTRAVGAQFERTGRTVVIRRRTVATQRQAEPAPAASLRMARSNETRE